jgi:hypothetical protein
LRLVDPEATDTAGHTTIGRVDRSLSMTRRRVCAATAVLQVSAGLMIAAAILAFIAVQWPPRALEEPITVTAAPD